MTFNDRIKNTLERIARASERGMDVTQLPEVKAAIDRHAERITLAEVNDDVTNQWSPVVVNGEPIAKVETPMPVIEVVRNLDQDKVDRLIPAEFSWNPKARP